MFPRTVFEQSHSFEDWIAMEVHVHGILTAEELIASQISNDEFLKFGKSFLELLDFGIVLESGEECTPEVAIHKLIKLLHLKFHLSSFH